MDTLNYCHQPSVSIWEGERKDYSRVMYNVHIISRVVNGPFKNTGRKICLKFLGHRSRDFCANVSVSETQIFAR